MIDHRLVAAALTHVDTSNFEKFAQVFYGAIQDRDFVPLGGIHDGGAEGFDVAEPELFEDEASSSFIQASKDDETVTGFVQVFKQVTIRKKIRDTVKRITRITVTRARITADYGITVTPDYGDTRITVTRAITPKLASPSGIA